MSPAELCCRRKRHCLAHVHPNCNASPNHRIIGAHARRSVDCHHVSVTDRAAQCSIAPSSPIRSASSGKVGSHEGAVAATSESKPLLEEGTSYQRGWEAAAPRARKSQRVQSKEVRFLRELTCSLHQVARGVSSSEGTQTRQARVVGST